VITISFKPQIHL